MDKPELSAAFTVADIRALRDYNSLRHRNMTTQQINEESQAAVEKCLAYIASVRSKKINMFADGPI